jgi:hypothetical protein
VPGVAAAQLGRAREEVARIDEHAGCTLHQRLEDERGERGGVVASCSTAVPADSRTNAAVGELRHGSGSGLEDERGGGELLHGSGSGLEDERGERGGVAASCCRQ